MKSFRILSGALGATIMAVTLAGCSNENEPNLPDTPANKDMHTCVMTFSGSRPSFEGETRSSEGWENGDKVYIIFGENEAYGTGQYNNGDWILNYNGTISETANSSCRVVYCEDVDYTAGNVISLTPNSGIYEGTGMYSYTDETLNVNATLSPKTGRIRFAGDEGEAITVVGVTYNSQYDISTGTFYTTPIAMSATVSGGYTPYIYGSFTNTENPFITIITSDNAFSRRPGKSVLKTGESGYMNIPSVNSPIAWKNEAVVSVNGVEFTMIPVEYEAGNFMLAQTETTLELYAAVAGTTSTTSKKPEYYFSSSEWKSWISRLNTLTGLYFYIPSTAQWQYAYKGGNRSTGYTYSGSDIVGDVAWYSGNASSAYHEVAQKRPNELGFYDMSGNVAELTEDNYDFYGGGYNSSASNVLATSYMTSYSYSGSGGCRLALSFSQE